MRSKYDYDVVNLFQPEPPEGRHQIKKLFRNRTDELEQGVGLLRRCMDVRGRRKDLKGFRPWVIHGESRSGKSHLARRVLHAFPDGPKTCSVLVSARERLEARRVMEMVSEHVRYDYNRILALDKNKDQVSKNPWIRLTDSLIEQVAVFLGARTAESLVLKWGLEATKSVEAGAKLDFVPAVLQFFGSVQVSTKRQQA